MTTFPPDQKFFVFDVESGGLHGEGFAVAGGIYDRQGLALSEFAYHSEIPSCTQEDWAWIVANINIRPSSICFETRSLVRQEFWTRWQEAKEAHPGIIMAAECGWPVEARFLIACIEDDREARNWSGPYPLHEIASFMAAAGMDPMATYDRLPNELPSHDPLADSRLSVRLLVQALDRLDAIKRDRLRLDFLDECNRRLNEKCGSSYGWELILSHNVTRLMMESPFCAERAGVDLHDSQAPAQAKKTCRQAIDAVKLAFTSPSCPHCTQGYVQDSGFTKCNHCNAS